MDAVRIFIFYEFDPCKLMKNELNITYELYDNDAALEAKDLALLILAREASAGAYAPYSKFLVGAAAMLNNGKIITGTNQENASYPVGICAERVLLSAAAVLHPNEPRARLAISYSNLNGLSDKPISPCGICRQSLLEYEERMKQGFKIIMSGLTGKILIISSAAALLPFSFGSSDLA